jgi:DNA-binding XRE family transcriptional regulator
MRPPQLGCSPLPPIGGEAEIPARCEFPAAVWPSWRSAGTKTPNRVESNARQTRPVGAMETLRRSRHLRQADLARLVGCSRSLIAITELGYRPPLHRRAAIAAALDVPIEELWPSERTGAAREPVYLLRRRNPEGRTR